MVKGSFDLKNDHLGIRVADDNVKNMVFYVQKERLVNILTEIFGHLLKNICDRNFAHSHLFDRLDLTRKVVEEMLNEMLIILGEKFQRLNF
jgi:hypothetical protein